MPESQYLSDILILLAAAVILVPLMQRLRFGSVLGYLVAGAAVGPAALGLIDDIEEIRHFAEFGVVFLLFVIGIELDPRSLWAMRRTLVGLGTLQVVLTGTVLAGLALAFGVPTRTAVVVGFALALSSTAFGLQLLMERGELATGFGGTAFSILLLQDLAVVPLLALVSILAEPEISLSKSVGVAALEAVGIVVAVVLAGRFLLTPALRLIAASRNAEVFTAAAILAVLGTAWLVAEAGLSMALGAFLAGLLLADSEYRHQILADIQPFRAFLLGLFFMAVGMSVDFSLVASRTLPVLGLVFGLLVIKTTMLWGLCRLTRVNKVDAVRVAFLLGQSGEFAFVLFGLAAMSGLMSADLFELLVLVVASTMVVTPLADRISSALVRRTKTVMPLQELVAAQAHMPDQHAIIAGFGRVGRRVAKMLTAAGVPYLALDIDPYGVTEGRRAGFSVYYGDASRADVLRAAGAERARVFVVTINHVATAERAVTIMRQQYPATPIHARARDRQTCDDLRAAGATGAVSETAEASVQLAGNTLLSSGVAAETVARVLAEFRDVYYA